MRKCKTILFLVILMASALYGKDGYELWLDYEKTADPVLSASCQRAVQQFYVPGTTPTDDIIRKELVKGIGRMLGGEALPAEKPGIGTMTVGLPEDADFIREFVSESCLDSLGTDGFLIQTQKGHGLFITANTSKGLLYGTFHLLRMMQTGESLEAISIKSIPRIEHRLLNHWDNPNRSVERGYAGKSLWKWKDLPEKVDARYADYARANASIGINGSVLNNVNADPIMLTTPWLKKVAAIADVFRPYGIRVYLSVKFSSPLKSSVGNLDTADPRDPEVHQWWQNKVKEIYTLIPDFGGFTVKANSEGQPGPHDYNRTHAEGANMLAEALAPYDGIVMWRAFVYKFDTHVDRAKQAYNEFVPQDGDFADNVFIQAKNGPIDFQPREPVQPLFGALKKSQPALELQITQEYLGHSTHLVYLAPMWKEYLDSDTYAEGAGSPLSGIIDGSIRGYASSAIAGVANTGSDRNWTGHLFGQANWYAYGRLAWDHSLSADHIAEEWIRMTLSAEPDVIKTIQSMMLGSWEACINYMTPLGLHHIMQEGFHYGPGPDVDGLFRSDWNSTYYHQADTEGIGFDRTAAGSDAISQYTPELQVLFSREKCPEKFLLWFHHVPWDASMASGRTLWDEMCVKYQSGVDSVAAMRKTWAGLEDQIDPEIHRHVTKKLSEHYRDADVWKETCLDYFQKFSQEPIIKK